MSVARGASLLPGLAVVAAVCGGSCAEPPAPKEPARAVWSPGRMYPSDRAPVRGLVDVRGLIHAHSVYSHDACDDAPVDEAGARDPVCFEDFRRGLCESKHDFVFLTDHGNSFIDTEYPEALLYRPERGDTLIAHEDVTSANLAACPDGSATLVMAGTETGLMPVGLEGHVGTVDERRAVYTSKTTDTAQVLRDHGAVVLLAHPEDYSVEELLELPIDGFEMYNLHHNALINGGVALDLMLRANDKDPGLLHPDLFLFALWLEDPAYLQRWGNVLAAGKRVISTMGTDCHRNAFRGMLADGERGDSYRRMMVAFSNHLRVRPNADGSLDDRTLKDALAAGRTYGVFEMMGHPEGFDAYVTDGQTTWEMGDTVPVGAKIVVKRPSVRELDPTREPPVVTMRVLQATSNREGFEELARGDGETLELTLERPGAVRVEVRMSPRHLREDLGDDGYTMIDDAEAAGQDRVWIYGTPFYVTAP